MKTYQLLPSFKTCLLFVFGAILFSSCMRQASLTVLQPAQMKLPEHISRVAVVDRSKPSKGWLNVLEGAVTGEAIGQDRQSRAEAVRGLTDALTRTPRFEVKNTGIEMTGSKAGNNLPYPLDWHEVEKICDEYNADAVVTIESFDSDNSTSTRTVQNKKKDKNGKEYTETSYRALQRTSVRIGWRMYDPRQKIIIDEFVTDDFLEKESSGSTERNAISNLPSQVTISRNVAFSVGREYGARIAPIYVNVNRSYYAKAKGHKDEMKAAARLAGGGSWDKAAIAWKKLVDMPDDGSKKARKAKGRAAYNMAVASEMSGNLEVALEWAKTAWEKYHNSEARQYIETIKQRQNDVRKVDYQMNKKV